MLRNYSYRSLLETSSMFWKSGENLNMEELINPMLTGYNFTENFTVDIAVKISRNAYHNIHSCFSGKIYLEKILENDTTVEVPC